MSTAWYDQSSPLDPGESSPDLNLFPPGVMPEGMPTPVAQTPATNPIASTMFAGMGISAIGAIANSIESASAEKAQGAYESSIANANAEIAGVQEKQALQTGDIQASRENLKTQQAVGTEKAVQGASGVDVASGSAAAVRAGTTGVGAINELTIRNNAQRQAWGYQTQAIQSTYQGQFAQLTAKAQAMQSLLSGGLTAISGPLAIESNYLRFARYMGVSGNPAVNAVNVPQPYPNAS